MGHIFISYSRKDAAEVEALAARLETDGFDVWIDREDLGSGKAWRAEIVQAIDAADSFILMLSPNSIKSANVLKEVDLADGDGLRMFPTFLARVAIPNTLRYQLAGLQYTEYYRDPAAKYTELLAGLQACQAELAAAKRRNLGQAELVIEGANLSSFGAEQQEKLLELVAQLTGTERTSLRIAGLAPGSLHVLIDLPFDKAYLLKTLALNRERKLSSQRIVAVRLSGDKYFVHTASGRVAPLTGQPNGWLSALGRLLRAAFVTTVMLGLGVAGGWWATRTYLAPLPPTVAAAPSLTPTLTATSTLKPSASPTATSTPSASPTNTPTPRSAGPEIDNLTVRIITAPTEMADAACVMEFRVAVLAANGVAAVALQLTLDLKSERPVTVSMDNEKGDNWSLLYPSPRYNSLQAAPDDVLYWRLMVWDDLGQTGTYPPGSWNKIAIPSGCKLLR